MTVKITKIEKVSRKNLYNIFCDDVVLATINDFSVVNLGIKVGKEFDEDQFREMIGETKKSEAFETLLNILGQTALTEYLAKTKLRQKGFDDDAIFHAIDKAVGYGYINDSQYAETYIRYATGKSKKRIKAELASKGVFENSYATALDEYDEYEACLKYMRKVVKHELDEESKRKVFSRVYMQGFPYDVIKNVYEDVLEEL